MSIEYIYYIPIYVLVSHAKNNKTTKSFLDSSKKNKNE